MLSASPKPGAAPPTAPPPNSGASYGSSGGVSGQNAAPPGSFCVAVVLHWMPGSNPHYVQQVVKRREAGVRPEVWTDFEVDVSAHTYTDGTAASGKTYIYRVKGLRGNGRGGTSGRAAVTVP